MPRRPADRPPAAAALGRPAGRLRRAVRWGGTHLLSAAVGIAVVDVGLVLVFGAITPGHAFLQLSNFTDLGLDASEIVLLSCGSAFLLGARELDISLGANVILSSVVGGRLMVALGGPTADVQQGIYPHLTVAVLVGVLGALATGLAFGLVNGLIVTRLRVTSFITTLGTLGIGMGLSYVLTNGSNIAYIPSQLQTDFGTATVAGWIPVPALTVVLIVAVLWFLLNRTRFGLRTIAIGSSRETARRAGLPIERHLLTLFGMVGGFAGLCGVIDLSRFATTDLSGHQTDALTAIAGAVIGGTTLYGGGVAVWGAVFGALLAVILDVGLVILGLPTFYQLIAVGVILIAAVYLRSGTERRSVWGRLSALTRRPGRSGGNTQAGSEELVGGEVEM